MWPQIYFLLLFYLLLKYLYIQRQRASERCKPYIQGNDVFGACFPTTAIHFYFLCALVLCAFASRALKGHSFCDIVKLVTASSVVSTPSLVSLMKCWLFQLSQKKKMKKIKWWLRNERYQKNEKKHANIRRRRQQQE